MQPFRVPPLAPLSRPRASWCSAEVRFTPPGATGTGRRRLKMRSPPRTWSRALRGGSRRTRTMLKAAGDSPAPTRYWSSTPWPGGLINDPTNLGSTRTAKSGAALFYGAAVALRRGDLPLARQRFAGLLELDPPPSADVRPIIEQQIAAIDERLAAPAGAPDASASADGRTAGTQGSAPPPQGNERPAPANSGPVPPVKVRVTISPKMNAESLASYPLFVIVRDPRRAGPPLAVKRLKATFPQSVELTTGDSMLPDHSFAKGQVVEVVARVSKTGSPTASPGDPVGLAAHTVGQGGVVDIQIEHVSP